MSKKMLENLILDQIRIDRSKNKLVLGIRNYGEFYVNNWMNCYVTRPLGPLQLKKLEDEIKNDPGLNAFKTEISREGQNAIFNLVRLYAPIGINKKLPKYFKGKSKDENGKYHEHVLGSSSFYAKQTVGNVGSVVSLDERLAEILKEKINIDNAFKQFDKGVAEAFKDRYKLAYISRLRNLLNGVFDKYGENNLDNAINEIGNNSILNKNINKNNNYWLIERRKDISDKVFGLNNKLKQLNADSFAELDAENSLVHLHVHDNKPYLQVNRMMNYEEIMQQKFCFIDIEIPGYKTPESAEISWIGLYFYKNGEIKRIIITNKKVSSKVIDGYGILESNNVVKTAETIVNLEDPLFIIPYNANFDLIKPKETEGGFAIGANETNPKKDVTLSFFERIDVRKRIVLDLFRFAKTAFSYLPNQKLETVAQHPGYNFKKIAKHSELAALEDNNPESFASYLASDVEILAKIMLESDIGRKSMQDYAYLSSKFNVGLRELMHSSSAINYAQNWQYFKTIGTYREIVYPKYADNVEFEKNARKQFAEIVKKGIDFDGKNVAGLHKNVAKAFVPVGDYLRDVVGIRFPSASELFSYKYQFLDDPQRQYFLSRYADSLANFIATYYGALDIDEKRHGKDSKNAKRAAIRLEGNYNVTPFQIKMVLYQKFAKLNSFLKQNDIGILSMSSDGRFLYLKNFDYSNKELVRKAPFILADTIDAAYIADKVYYEKYCHINGLRLDDEPRFNLSLFEMGLYGEFIKDVLARSIELARQNIRNRYAGLLDAKNHELVYYNKEKEVYSAFENGQRIYFRENPAVEVKDSDEIDDDLLFADSEFKPGKIQIRKVEDIKPDLRLYSRHIGKKLDGLMSGLKSSEEQKKLFG